LLGAFREGRPHLNHTTLARLMKAGLLTTVCTTNVDLLLERALEIEGLSRTDHYDVAASDGDYERLDWAASRCRLIEIHGTCDNPDSIVATNHPKQVVLIEHSAGPPIAGTTVDTQFEG
jgi:NAD-dependent SIR2 family protein deacetylase